ncbi:MAG TPA: DUF6580 family putative transport protein [Acidobacteriota bacterium]|nr:DUF6580 family putative transport protein [Acidobacteriota bacterium]
MWLPIVLILIAALFRVLATMDFSFANISPIMAIAFCGAVYFRKRWTWAVPFVALCASDIYINWFYAREYGYALPTAGYIARFACFAAAILIGRWVATRKSWLWLLNGSLLGALLFYIVTNTQSWWSDPFYAKTLAGWWQALTIGHPEFPPTIYFFKNTLFGDLMFTGLFAGIMEFVAHRKSEPSLLDSEEEDEESDEETAPAKEEAAKAE